MDAQEKKRDNAEKEARLTKGKYKEDKEIEESSDPYDIDNGQKYDYEPMTAAQKRYILGNSMDRPRFTYE